MEQTIAPNVYLNAPNRPKITFIRGNLPPLALFAKMAEDPIDTEIVIDQMKLVWKNIHNVRKVNPHVVHENLILFRFSSQEDRDNVWENRPYHVHGKLLVLLPYPWIPYLDPSMTSIEGFKRADMWIRIPIIPPQLFKNIAILKHLLSENNIGIFVRYDVKNNKKFAPGRVCVNVDVSVPLNSYICYEDVDGSIPTFKVWYEDFSEGCGCCGDNDHVFDDCPDMLVQQIMWGFHSDFDTNFEIGSSSGNSGFGIGNDQDQA